LGGTGLILAGGMMTDPSSLGGQQMRPEEPQEEMEEVMAPGRWGHRVVVVPLIANAR